MEAQEHWPRAREAFEELAELGPEGRSAALEVLRESEPDVAQLVAELLEGHDETGPVDGLGEGLLEGGQALELVASLHGRVQDLTPAPLKVGEGVGAFEILGKLGEGGMATVYRARRSTEDFHQEVALKILAPHRLTEQGLARFQLERQLAASLDHPHIAKLIDGGITADGRPFFALELVEGEPIDRYCQARGSSLEERLRLMIDVARAVHHAHRRLIVHRDLKPSNVLVSSADGDGDGETGSRSGQVKLVDFGIAKILPSEGGSGDATRTVERVMTPQYASPEQFLGRPVTVASDVYQLGLILYQLITGELPYRLDTLTPAQQQRAICEDPPSRPSTKAREASKGAGKGGDSLPELGGWKSRLGSDLDNIVLKALRKEPDERFGSAEQLAEDLERFLAGRPVLASRQTWAYVARKTLGRHRAVVALVAASLAVIVAIGTLAALRVVDERDRAEQALEESRAVADFLTEIFTASNPFEKPGEDATASELLERGLERADELEGEPRIQAQVLYVVGEVYAERRDYEKALGALQRALELRRELFGMEDLEVAKVLSKIGMVQRRLGHHDEAELNLRDAVRQFRRFAPEPGIELAEALNNFGVLRSNQGFQLLLNESQEAELAFDEAAASLIEAAAVLAEIEPESRHAATVLGNVGSLYNKRRDFASALKYQQEALEHHLRLGRLHPGTALTYRNLAMNLQNLERYELALERIEESYAIRLELFGEVHVSTLTSLGTRGEILSKLGRHQEAIETQRKMLKQVEELDGPTGRMACYAHTNLGLRLLAAGELSEAEEAARRGLDMRLQKVEASSRRLYYHRHALSQVLAAAGKVDQAIEHYGLTLAAAPAEKEPELRETLERLKASRSLEG